MQSLPEIERRRRNGANTSIESVSLMNVIRTGSMPAILVFIRPNESDQTSETIIRYIIRKR
jgi:hypothetical protein